MIGVEEYTGRIDRVRTRCREEGLDAFLATSGDNLYYLTGKSFMPFERPFILIIRAEGEPTFIVPQLEVDHLRVISHITDFVTYYEYPAEQEKSWHTILSQQTAGMKRIGTDLYTRSEIFSLLGKEAEVECFDWVYSQRFTKSPAEIDMLRETARYVRASMGDFMGKVRKGSMVLDTLEPAKQAQKKAMMDRGFDIDFLAFNFLSAGWPDAAGAEPHSIPNPAHQFTGGPNMMVMSYRVDGYAIELERTFFTGEPDDTMKERFSHMLEARKIAFSMLKPGVACHDVDAAVREFILSKGYAENLIHRTGHGMGVSNHEGPFLAMGSQTILEPGMVLTVEPGIYFTGHGAYRHSDTVVITETGYECLTEFPTDIGSLTHTKRAGLSTALKRMVLSRMLDKGRREA